MVPSAFFNAVRATVFGGSLTQGQVNGCEQILAASEGLPISHRAYLLATAHHETAHTMLPVRETLAKDDTQAIRRLNKAWQDGKLKWVKTPYWRRDKDGKAWFGRGYVQLTHKRNYEKMGKRLTVDLVADPTAAMNPDVAAQILVLGCKDGMFRRGHTLERYLPGDYEGARAIVNGPDGTASKIARNARRFEAALKAASIHSPPQPRQNPATTAPVAANRPKGLAALLSALVGLFTRKD